MYTQKLLSAYNFTYMYMIARLTIWYWITIGATYLGRTISPNLSIPCFSIVFHLELRAHEIPPFCVGMCIGIIPVQGLLCKPC